MVRKGNTKLTTRQPTFYFYDLETSGFNPRSDRIMQFAGQRTDLDLNPVGNPDNVLISLTDDVLPSPDAILVTGITPQKTRAEGITEAEFIRMFDESISLPGTIFVGFNNIRFDDEFMRFLFYRNYYDAYEWQWKDDRARWDMLDVVRMTRALRPDGIKWPFDSDGKATNRLELLASLNKLEHTQAHDALSDVQATIDVAKLIKMRQPKLFSYLLKVKDKKEVAAIARNGNPFVYTSGKYASEHEKTTVVWTVSEHPKTAGALVYDLRYDPAPFLTMNAEELAESWKYKKDSTELRLPVKTLRYNRCPAIAILEVLDEASQKRLGIDKVKIDIHLKKIEASKDFASNLIKAVDILDSNQQLKLSNEKNDVDGQLYDKFIPDLDRETMKKIRITGPQLINQTTFSFNDKRLKKLLTLYKARNFPKQLTDDERTAWEDFRNKKLQSQLPNFFARMQALVAESSSTEKQYLLEELRLYAESIMPAPDV